MIRREIRPLWDLRGLVRLKTFLSGAGYSIIHTHTSKPGVVATLAARRAGIPAVMHTVHLFAFHEESGRAAMAAYVAAQRTAARWCDRIVTVSEFQRRWALEKGIGTQEQVIAIPNGVPEERARATRERADVRGELGVEEAFVVLSTGRLASQKGLEHLVRAAALIRDVPRLRVLLAGDGPLEGQLSRLVSELGLDGIVTFLGHRSDIGDLLAAADLVVLPSLWEGLSISLLEAMAAGKPVVTTTIGGNVEVTNAGEAAMLVPPKDPVRLAAAIRGLAADAPLRERLGKRGQEVQRERYTMRRMLDSYLAEYDRLLSRTTAEASARLLPVGGAS